MCPGASVLYVWATRISLLRAVRTEGTGQLAPGGHCCTYAVRVPASGVPYVPRTEAPSGTFSPHDGLWKHAGWAPLQSVQAKLRQLDELGALLASLGERPAAEGAPRRGPATRAGEECTCTYTFRTYTLVLTPVSSAHAVRR